MHGPEAVPGSDLGLANFSANLVISSPCASVSSSEQMTGWTDSLCVTSEISLIKCFLKIRGSSFERVRLLGHEFYGIIIQHLKTGILEALKASPAGSLFWSVAFPSSQE